MTPFAARATAALVLAAAASMVAGPAAAHDALLGTDPAAGAVLDSPPATVSFTYSRDVAPEFVSVAVASPAAALTPVTAVTVSGPTVTVDLSAVVTGAPEGAWRVVARIVSTDGHPVDSILDFTAGPGPLPATTTTTTTTIPNTGATTAEPGAATTSTTASTPVAPTPVATSLAAEPVSTGTRTRSVWLAAGLVLLVTAVAGAAVLVARRR